MNSFALVSATHEDWGRYLEIEIDGKRLAHHFADRMGAHPSFLSPLGWRKNRKLHSSVIAKMLGDPPSNLGSSRVTVLFGDFDDGEFSVLILKEATMCDGQTGRTKQTGRTQMTPRARSLRIGLPSRVISFLIESRTKPFFGSISSCSLLPGSPDYWPS